MIKRKRFRQKGKLRLSEAFKELKKGDKVMLVGVPGSTPLPPQFRGRTAEVVEKAGKAFIVKFLNGKRIKRLTINPNYLRKLKS